MGNWTVFGMYEDDGEVLVEFVEADDAWKAMKKVAASLDSAWDVVIVAAVEGRRYPFFPCDDSGKSASAIDLLDD